MDTERGRRAIAAIMEHTGCDRQTAIKVYLVVLRLMFDGVVERYLQKTSAAPPEVH